MTSSARGAVGHGLIAATLLIAAAACRPTVRAPQSDSSRRLLMAVIAASSHATDDSTSAAERPSDLSPAARVALDSGNRLYRAGKYPEALVQYQLTAERSPGDATAYFGIQMVGAATHDTALANSALATLRKLGGSAAGGPHPAPAPDVSSRP